MSLGGSVFSCSLRQPAVQAGHRQPAIDRRRHGHRGRQQFGDRSASRRPAAFPPRSALDRPTSRTTSRGFRTSHSFLSLLAPGEAITSSVPGGAFQALSGTSMATPHVAGSVEPAQSRRCRTRASARSSTRCKQTGLPIADTRPAVRRRFRASASSKRSSTLAPVENPQPVVTSMSPTSGRAGMASLTLTLTGSGFDGFSVVRWNGSDRLTTVVNTTTIQAAITAADLASGRHRRGHGLHARARRRHVVGADVHDRRRAATLSVSASTVAPGASVTVNAGEWVRRRAGLACVGVGGRAEHEQSGVDLCRRQRDDPIVERGDAGYRRHVRIPPVPRQRVHPRGHEPAGRRRSGADAAAGCRRRSPRVGPSPAAADSR